MDLDNEDDRVHLTIDFVSWYEALDQDWTRIWRWIELQSNRMSVLSEREVHEGVVIASLERSDPALFILYGYKLPGPRLIVIKGMRIRPGSTDLADAERILTSISYADAI